jgi:hypothetical protein
MFTINKKLFILLLLLFVVTLSAEPVDLEKAFSVGYNWLTQQQELQGRREEITLKDSYVHKLDELTIFYVFNFEPEGFVIIAGDDASVPVLGYNTTGAGTLAEIPNNASSFFEIYEQSIIEIYDEKLSNESTAGEWEAILSNEIPTPPGLRTVEPLLSIKWNQNYPWNQNCPQNSNGPGGHVYAGCVAVAMAQVMKYWSHPEQGTGSHTYHHPSYGWLSADFGDAIYNWDNMPDLTATSSTSELLFHLGVAVEMNYGASVSTAPSARARHALVQFFDYHQDAHLTYRVNYTASEWINLLKDQLDNQQPMYYQGYNQSHQSGHAFNCDGYDANNLFHFNWGWGGGYDGYYQINSLNPGNSNYSYLQAAIINLKPSEFIFHPPDLLTAELAGTNSVMLNWEDFPEDMVINWDNSLTNNGIGNGSSVVFKVAARFLPSHLADFGVIGGYLTKIRFVPREVNCSYSLNVWLGGTANDPGSLVVEQPVTLLLYYEWNTIELDNPVYISGDQELWIGYHINTQTGYPAGCDSGPAVDGLGNMIKWNNQWTTLLSFGSSMNFNWNLQGVVESAPRFTGATGSRPEVTNSLSFGHKNSGLTDFIRDAQSITDERNFSGYNVYRDNDVINTEPVIDSYYLDENLSIGTYSYHVTAVYEGGESDPSNPAEITLTGDFQPDPPFVEISISDGLLTLSWETVTGADHYKIYAADDPYSEEPEWQELDTTNGSSYSESLTTDRRFYRVVAVPEEPILYRRVVPVNVYQRE